MSIAALILAAGASRRMGRPKALLPFRETTFIGNIINATRDAAIVHVVVAVSRLDDKTISAAELAMVPVVVNAEPDAAGPIGSIRAALRFLINHVVEYLMVWPVDLPHIQVRTLRNLIGRANDGHPDILVPSFNGRRGHPVLFAKRLFPELLAAPDDQGARFVVRRIPERVMELPVDDPAVLDDIDTPEDYDRLISSTKSLL